MISPFRCYCSPLKIIIGVKKLNDLKNQENERTIAHEATHGYVTISLGYWQFVEREKTAPPLKFLISNISSLIEDFVVNKITQENGFEPIPVDYFDTLKQTTERMRMGEEILTIFNEYPEFRIAILISNYFLAWGSNEYLDLKDTEREVLKDYLTQFNKFHVDLIDDINILMKYFSNFNVFKKEGHFAILKGFLTHFKLIDFGEFANFSHYGKVRT
ncbi:MAG: hypothetical protein ACTSUK_07335, partial [Promethearchaeota archaeon]